MRLFFLPDKYIHILIKSPIKRRLFLSVGALMFGVLPIAGILTFSTLTSRQDSNEPSAVLGAATESADPQFVLNVNVPSFFKEQAEFLKNAVVKGSLIVNGEAIFSQGIDTKGEDIDLGTGSLTASNVIYSLTGGNGITVSNGQKPVITNSGVLSVAGKNGDVVLEAGSGLGLDGLKYTNTDPGSAQNIFKKVAVSGQSEITAGSNSDTLTFVAGSGVSIVTDASGKSLTISSTEQGLSNWTVGSDFVSTTGNVGIGTTDPQAALDVNGSTILRGLTTITSGGLVLESGEIDINGGGIVNAGAITGATGLTSSGTITFSGMSQGIVHAGVGGVLSSSALNLAGGANEITGILSINNGGTGLASYLRGQLMYSDADNSLATLSIGSEGQTLVVGPDGLPMWGQGVGGAGLCVTCVVLSPGSTQTITATNSAATGLSIKQASGGTVDVFNVMNNAGTMKYLQVDSTGNVGIARTASFGTSAYDPLVIAPRGAGATSFMGLLTSEDLTAIRTYTLPDASGTFCLTTGNCNGVGGNFGGTGTTNYVAKFTNGTTVGDSSIYDDGNVGIGTSNPLAKLYVAGTTNFTGNSIVGGTFDASGAAQLASTLRVSGATSLLSTLNVTGATSLSSTLNVTSNTTIGGTLTSSGNVGIGTTGPTTTLQLGAIAPNVPNRVLTLTGYDDFGIDFNSHNSWNNYHIRSGYSGGLSIYNTGNANTTNTLFLGTTTSGNALLKLYTNNGDAINIGSHSVTGYGVAKIGTSSPTNTYTGDLYFDVAYGAGTYNRFTFKSSGDLLVPGNVGIGTTTAAYPLQIGATGNNSFYFDTANRRLTVGGNIQITSGSPNSVHDASGNGLLLSSQGAYVALGRTGFGEGLRVDLGGGAASTFKIGIGTTAPVAKLDVNGQITGKALAIFNQTGDQDIFTASSSGTTKFVINNSGNVGVGTSSPTGTLNVLGNSENQLVLSKTSNGTRNWLIGIGTGGQYSEGSLVFGFGATPTSTNAVMRIAPQDFSGTKLLIDPSGNLGIGTTSASNFKITVAGNVGPSAGSTYDLGSASLPWNNLYVNNIIGASTGTSGYWQRALGAISPTNSSDDMLLGGTATASALVKLGGTSGASTYFNTGGNVGIGTTTASSRLDIQSSGLNTDVQRWVAFDGSRLARITETSGGAGWFEVDNASGVAQAMLRGDGGSNYFLGGNMGIGTSTPGSTLDVVSTATTTNGLNVSANSLTSGYGAYFSSTSTGFTSGSLLGLDWSPGSATTATGDLLSLNIGANGSIGNIFNIKDNGASVFSVSQTGVTANLPVNFTSPGDVSIAYDLGFTNPIASYITSGAPLYLRAGKVYNSSDLTLATYNKGNVIVDSEAFVSRNASVSGQLVLGTTVAPANIGGMYLTNSQTYGKALAIFNQTESADIFTASASGATKFVISNSGNVGVGTSDPAAKIHIVNSSGNTFYAQGQYGGLVVNNEGTILSTSGGSIFGASSWSASNGSYQFVSLSDRKVVTVKGAFTQNANLQEWQSYFGTPVASIGPAGNLTISGGATGGNALAILNQTGASSNAIFTASSSGSTKFVIANNGNVGIGTTNTSLNRFTLVNDNTQYSQQLELSTVSSSQQALIGFDSAGTQKWQMGKDADESFIIWDGAAARQVVKVTPSGTFSLMPAGGNVGIGTTNATLGPLQVANANNAYVSTGGTWTNGSSRDFKENIDSVNTDDILSKINQLDISEWNYINEGTSVKHIGPIAEDFYSIFGVGNDNKHISTIDPAGVALAGIKALSKQVEDLKSQIQTASISANFAPSVASLGISDTDATISGTLTVLGRTTVNDLGVTGKIVSGLTSIDGATGSINVLGDLKLQSNGYGTIDLFAGKVKIDNKGNMNTEGTLTAKAVKTEAVQVLGSSTGDADTIGKAVLKAGTTSIVIPTTAVTSTSKIFVTPRSKTGNRQLIVTQTTNGNSFKVEVENAASSDISFDWWVIN